MIRKTTLNSLICLTLLSFCSEKANAQWSAIASMGVGPTDGCFSFSLHGKGYVGGGSNGSHFYEYDTTFNTWTLKGNAPGNKIRGFAFSFVANGHGYAGCGDTTGSNNSCFDMWMYNDTTNMWTQKASFPGGHRDGMLFFAINDTGYAGGGFDPSGSGYNDFYKYNPFTDTWTSLPVLPDYVGFPAAFVISGKGYLATGQIGSSESTGVWQFNPSSNTWTAKAAYPGPPKQTAFGFALNNYGYVGGGMAGYDTSFTDMWRYDPAANVWFSAPAFPSLYAAWGTAFTIGGTAYVGATSFINATTLLGTDTFRRYRGVLNTTAVTENKAQDHIVLYPNPAGDYLSVGGDIQPGSTIAVYDVAGREMKTFTGDYSHLYIGDIPSGVYVLRCICTTGIYIEKLVKK